MHGLVVKVQVFEFLWLEEADGRTFVLHVAQDEGMPLNCGEATEELFAPIKLLNHLILSTGV